jgi:myo-inositol-1-phosphate synthase
MVVCPRVEAALSGRVFSMANKIRVAIVGVGNCASSLVQGVYYYRNAKDDGFVPGVMHVNFGGYHINDIEVVAAFDVNSNKVGKDVAQAIYAAPNNTTVFAQVPDLGVKVQRGPLLDGVNKYTAELVPVAKGQVAVDVVEVLKEAKVDAVINYLPVGSQQATEFYAQAAIDAGCGFVNCIPVFLASATISRRRSVQLLRTVHW